MYIKKSELSKLVVDWQASGEMPPQLIAVMGQMVWGCYFRYFRGAAVDLDEATQRVLLLVLRKRDRFDPTRNLFAYFTQLVVNEIRHLLRDNRTWSKLHGSLPDED